MGVSARTGGWGLSPVLLQGVAFRVAAILVPVWLPLLIALLLGAQPRQSPVGLALLLAPFVFIPGVYVLTNVPAWSRIIKFSARVLFFVLGSATGYVALAALLPYLT